MLESSRFAETNHSLGPAIRRQKDEIQKLGIDSFGGLWFSDLDKSDLRTILSASVLTISPVLDRVMKAETTKQLTVTAIALKRYQLRNGNYPPSLPALVPEFLAEVPRDPVDGKPLRYRLDGKTFLLYSVGENGKDDGGDPSLEKGVESSSFQWQNSHALDWVWPQPASAEEIAGYQKLHSRHGP